MRSIKNARLVLSRQTLRNLTAAELRSVGGAMPDDGDDDWPLERFISQHYTNCKACNYNTTHY